MQVILFIIIAAMSLMASTYLRHDIPATDSRAIAVTTWLDKEGEGIAKQSKMWVPSNTHLGDLVYEGDKSSFVSLGAASWTEDSRREYDANKTFLGRTANGHWFEYAMYVHYDSHFLVGSPLDCLTPSTHNECMYDQLDPLKDDEAEDMFFRSKAFTPSTFKALFGKDAPPREMLALGEPK